MNSKKLAIIDLSNFIFRAFYAIRPLHAPDGTPVNAVHGVLSMILKLLSTYTPDHVLIAKEGRGEKFRKKIYQEYKANRSEAPDELKPQFAIINELIDLMHLSSASIDDQEADDIIGTAVTKWQDYFDEILIVSGDKDLMQFVNDKVKIVDTMKDKIIGVSDVFEKMGVYPNQVVDYLSLVGDSSDNIPGVSGIGEKGAAKLLQEYKTLESCIENVDKIANKRVQTALKNNYADALLSKKLVQINLDLELKIDPKQTNFSFYPSREFLNFLQRLGLKSMMQKMENLAYDLSRSEQNIRSIKHKNEAENVAKEMDRSFLSDVPASCVPLFFTNHTDINTLNDLDILIQKIDNISEFSLFIEHEKKHLTISLDGQETFSFGDACLAPFMKHLSLNYTGDIITITAKQDYKFFLKHDAPLKCRLLDLTVAHYVYNPDLKHDFDSICQMLFGAVVQKETPNILYIYTTTIFQCWPKIKELLITDETVDVFLKIDTLLLPILCEMEEAGISLNKEYLQELENKLDLEILKIEDEVYSLIGEKINLNSPKQVAELLFNKLQYPIIKKNKTGPSTDSEVLEELASLGKDLIPSLILKYREIEKLLSTYVRALPNLINQETKKIHTSFNLSVAASGRLSSSNPNIQNIPTRSDLGRLVRKAFVATPGKLLLAADYSQVELRILAHFSNDQRMIQAFLKDQDIHSQTAAEIRNISLENVETKDRAIAKTVNFGLMYGQSFFGLSRTLGISKSEAQQYIQEYFEKFKEVKFFLDTLKEECEKTGSTKTLFNRKRIIPEISANNRTTKLMAERMAINTPIQGTAADIIKLAMIAIFYEMKEQNLKSKMILQVHDELIFEVEEDELEIMTNLVRNKMESIVKLSVPLKVDIGVGVNWYDI